MTQATSGLASHPVAPSVSQPGNCQLEPPRRPGSDPSDAASRRPRLGVAAAVGPVPDSQSSLPEASGLVQDPSKALLHRWRLERTPTASEYSSPSQTTTPSPTAPSSRSTSAASEPSSRCCPGGTELRASRAIGRKSAGAKALQVDDVAGAQPAWYSAGDLKNAGQTRMNGRQPLSAHLSS